MEKKRLIKKLTDKDSYKMTELYVASIALLTDIQPNENEAMLTASFVPSYRFAIFHKPRFSKIYTRVKTELEYRCVNDLRGSLC